MIRRLIGLVALVAIGILVVGPIRALSTWRTPTRGCSALSD